ncbi:MAG: methylated-DNA--[protein]-cysteine S-methyltransferase [Methyloligellaceae bacterium]
MSASLNIASESAQSVISHVYKDLSESREDYEIIRKSLEYLTEHWKDLPSFDVIADHFGISASDFNSLFKRWAAMTPVDFFQSVTLDHAKDMLSGSADLLELTDVLGLSGPTRMHDLLISHEAMTPKDLKKAGRKLEIRYGFHDCPFGIALILSTDYGICGLGFCDDAEDQASLLEDMKGRWAQASYDEAQSETEEIARHLFAPYGELLEQPVKIALIGTDFEIKVWEALLKVPAGRAVTYSDLAEHIGSPGSHRAVGAAVGRNPISLVVPCHRVLRKDATLGGYHWGLTRKQAMIGWEAGKLKAEFED